MITLFVSAAGELCLTLRGADENRILTTLRRLPYWQRADIERDPDDPERCLAVTLIADQSHESHGLAGVGYSGVCSTRKCCDSHHRLLTDDIHPHPADTFGNHMH